MSAPTRTPARTAGRPRPGTSAALPAEKATVSRLHAAGTLVRHYPRVPALLADADPAELRRAGMALSALSADAVLAAHPDTSTVELALTGSSTLAPLAPPLVTELARHGLLGRVRVGDPGAFALQLGAPPDGPAPDLTLCLLDGSVVFDRFGDRPWTVDDVAAATAEVLELLRALVARHAETTGGALVLTTAPLWSTWSAQVLDLRERARLGAVWRRFTADLLDLGAGSGGPGTFVVDLEPLLGDTGPARDPRLEGYAHVAYTDALFAALARQVGHLARGLRGRPRKCLVLDLDGTLWGGTLAESGGDGLEMAQGYRGEAHRRFQRVVGQLGAQGVLLAVCSKNDPDEVAQVLRSHPDLLVGADDLTAVVADWAPKVRSVERVAEEIGIGTDSLVFVDDSPTEAGLLRAHRPEIATVEVDARDPAGHVSRLLADGWFDATSITDEDRERAGRYRTEARRAEFRSGFSSLTDYLAELGTTVSLYRPGDGDVARLAQLTQRTNQFNLMTERLDEPAVRAALADPAAVVTPVRVTDRFGDHGVVGVAFGHWQGTELRLDNLMMSCRVLGRGVESAWLGELLRWAAARGASGVLAGYRPTARNGRVAELYPQHGFAPLPGGPDPVPAPAGAGAAVAAMTGTPLAPGPEPDSAGTRWFRHDLTDLPAPLEHLTVEADLPATHPAPTGGHR